MGVAIGVLCTAPVAAAAPTARLVYSRAADAESCPDEGALRRAVAARVGYDPFFAWAQRTVVANVLRRNGAFVATVDLVDERGIAHGTRELHAAGECGELLDAVALAIAIAIDPQSLVAPAASPPADVDEPPPAPPISPPALAPPTERPAASAPAPAPTAVSVRTVSFEPSLGAVVSSGVAPSVALGVAVGVAARWQILSLALEGRLDAPASAAAQGGGDVSSWLALAAAVPCVHLGPVLGCGAVQGGSMQASGSGVPNAESRSAAWWAAGGRAGVVFPLAGDMLLRARADVLGNLSRATLRLNGQPAWTADPIAVSFGVDAVLRFR